MEFALTTVNSTVLAYGNEEYDVTKLPMNTSTVVADRKQELLGQLSLVQTFENMANAADLFYIVNLAVDGITGLHVNVSRLRQEFISTVSHSANVCASLYQKTEYAPLFLVKGYKAALNGKFDTVRTAFGEVSRIATEVMTKAQELVDLFTKLAKQSQIVCDDIKNERASDYDKMGELQKMLNTLQAKTKGLKEVQDSLDEEIAELQEEYIRLDKRLGSAENKSFWMGIASAVASCISSGMTAYTSSALGRASGTFPNNGEQTGYPAGSSGNSSASQSSTMTSTQKRLVDTNKKITDTKNRIENFKKEIDDLEEQISKVTNEEDKKELLSKRDTAANSKAREESALNSLEAEFQQDMDILNGIAVSLNNASDSLSKLSAEEKDTVSNLISRIENISSKKSALAKERRAILSQIAENTLIIESTVITQNELGLAITALASGIAAIQYIISLLNNFVKFWESIKTFAEGLRTTELTSLISMYDDEPEKLLSIELLEPVIRNSASWVALRDILIDYKNNFDSVFHRLNNQLMAGQEADRMDSWKKAVELSKGMSHIFQAQAEQL